MVYRPHKKYRKKKTSLTPLPNGIKREWAILPLTDPRRQAYEEAVKKINKPKKTPSQRRAEELRKRLEENNIKRIRDLEKDTISNILKERYEWEIESVIESIKKQNNQRMIDKEIKSIIRNATNEVILELRKELSKKDFEKIDINELNKKVKKKILNEISGR